MLTESSCTLYKFNGIGFDRYYIRECHWQECKASNVLKSGNQNADSIAVYIPAKSLVLTPDDTLASFYNITQDEAYTKLKSVFSGETETLKDLGIVMTQSALDSYALANGYSKTTSEMSEAEKVALRYNFVLNQLKNANGDYIRTQDNWANQVRYLQLQWQTLQSTV